jgi:hydroxylamine reductase
MYRQSTAARTFSTATSTASSRKVSQPAMFCRQCEQTSDHYACVNVGVCGKTSETANIQDALIAQIKSVAHWMVAAKKNNIDFEVLAPIHKWTLGAAFSTLTNVNFSSQRIAEYIALGEQHKQTLKSLVSEPPSAYQSLGLANKSIEDLEEFGLSVSVPKRAEAMGNEDAFSLNEIATYGLKVRPSK